MFAVGVPMSGLTYTRDLEWRLAAHWAGYRRFADFAALPGEEQSEVVAVYRAESRMRAVAEHEAMLEAKMKAGQ